MVVANAPVDIAALKARHSLGDAVEAAGVRLRGRGRVRQGVCPFHDEAEASFTVYADTEKFYCFGCGEGGDVLDFIQRVEGLTLPEAIRRLDGSPGLAPGAVRRPAATRRPSAAVVPPRDPALLTAAGSVLRRTTAPQPCGKGVPGFAGASASPPPCGWVSATRRGPACARPLSPPASPPGGSGIRGCSWSGGRSGSRGWRSFPTSPEGLSGGLRGGPSAPTPRPASSRFPAPSRRLGLGVSAPRRPGRCLGRAYSTGLPLRDGAFPLAPPWAPRAWRRPRPPCGAAAVNLPGGIGDVAELAAMPHGRAAFLRLLARAAHTAR